MSVGDPDGTSAPLLGQVVAERYFVEKHLGEGGMGTVYLAKHITLEKSVALKVLHGEFSRKEDLVERFLQEAKAASRIRNAHVIDITDFGVTSEGFAFFAMEYLEGKDLHGLLKEVVDSGQLLPWTRSQGIFLQVCEALAAAHKEGIIHRDLKPENIFLVEGTGRADYVKLLDFGIAKVEGSGAEGERKLTKTGMLFGTPEYMAPEQARGEKPDHRVDVYAMGCMLFQLLTGTVPFKAESFMAILTQHMVEPVPEISYELLALSGAPSGLLAIVSKALEKDRDQRYATIEELAQDVREASRSQSAMAALPQQAPRQKRASASPTGPAKVANWTGSVRQLQELAEDEEAEAEAVEQRAQGGPSRLVLACAAIILLAGGAVAALSFGGGDKAEKVAPAAEESAKPSVEVPDTKPDEGTGAEGATAIGGDTTAQDDLEKPDAEKAGTERGTAGGAESPVRTVADPKAELGAKEPATQEGKKPTGEGKDEATTKGESQPREGQKPTGKGETKGDAKEGTGDKGPGEPSLMRPPEFGQ